MIRQFVALLFVVASLSQVAQSSFAQGKISTREDRAALVDYLIKKTQEREAFSEPKNKRYDFDPIEAMESVRSEVVEAKNEVELYYALQKLSAARRDRHLSVGDLSDGPSPRAAFDGLEEKWGVDVNDSAVPVEFAADFTDIEKPRLFVSQILLVDGKPFACGLQGGEWIVAVNGMSIAEFTAFSKSLIRHSTPENFWMRMPRELQRFSRYFPPSFYRERLELRVTDGSEEKVVNLPYFDPDMLSASDEAQSEKYPGFLRVLDFVSFDIYVPDGEGDRDVVLMDWYGFREDLTEATTGFIEYAEQNKLLDQDLILDLTRSRGGSRGAFALKHLSPKPFRGTFGNLRLSDGAEKFIEQAERSYEDRNVNDNGVPETDDDGDWLISWLRGDVRKGIEAGQDYSNNVPFKCAHAPSYSDGIIKPAEKHFRGKMICWLSPHGGSHLDQFAAMVVDNDLAWTIGMPSGGYSNTWEYEEDVKFPISGKPAIEFMWSIGHTIRPNGQVLEGNPAQVHDFVPITRENHSNYREILMERSLKKLGVE